MHFKQLIVHCTYVLKKTTLTVKIAVEVKKGSTLNWVQKIYFFSSFLRIFFLCVFLYLITFSQSLAFLQAKAASLYLPSCSLALANWIKSLGDVMYFNSSPTLFLEIKYKGDVLMKISRCRHDLPLKIVFSSVLGCPM